MIEAAATLIVRLAGVYLSIGLVFAVAFVTVGAGRIDPVARNGTWGFKLLILPGTMALWPLLARRWLKGAGAVPCERNAHRDAARPEDTGGHR